MRQIQGSSDKISDKTDVILQMVNGNKGSPQLIREIHQMLLQAQVKPSPSAGVSIAKRTLETGKVLGRPVLRNPLTGLIQGQKLTVAREGQ